MIKLSNNILFKEIEDVVKNGGIVKLMLVGNSMFPFLRDGRDYVVLAPLKKEDLKRGAVALFKYNSTYILHRLISIEGGVYTFSGDGNIRLFESVYIDDIVALMISVEYSSGRKCSCNSFLWRSTSWFWLKLCPFRRYLLRICRVLMYPF